MGSPASSSTTRCSGGGGLHHHLRCSELIALPTLPVAQYPQIAPPTVTSAVPYPKLLGRDPLASTVAQPIEAQIGGVREHALHVVAVHWRRPPFDHRHLQAGRRRRQGTGAGGEPRGRRRVPGRLPAAVAGERPDRAQGLRRTCCWPSACTRPTTPSIQRYISNYFTLHVRDQLLRLPGVGDLGSRAARDYALRIWIDPDKAAARNLTVDDVVERPARPTTCRWPPARWARRRSGRLGGSRPSSPCRRWGC